MHQVESDLLAVWRRVTIDPTAEAELISLALHPLTDALSSWYPSTDPHLVETAVADALLAFLKRHDRYDPTKSPLFNFLLLVAKRRLFTLSDAEKRHHFGRIPWESVEFDTSDQNIESDDDSPTFDHPSLRGVLDSLTGPERRVFELMRTGERATVVYAVALEVGDRPASEQEAEVKRVKDRIKARMKRAGGVKS